MNGSELAEREQIHKDFEDAIARLLAGTPTNRKLKHLHAQGRLQLNCTSVAKEANHSRTLIGHEKCAYPEIRQRILNIAKPAESAIPRTAGETIGRLREKIKNLIAERDAALDIQHAMSLLLEEAERKVVRAEAQLRRRNQHAAYAGKVISLPS